MHRLSSPITKIKSRYDVVVVGSGYGGGIAASRLSRAGKRVCVLERGKERQPGEYPRTPLEGAGELQIDLPATHQGPRTGMFDVRVNKDISVVVGCGLGGTSLINASVSIRPDPRVFEDPRWPAALRSEGGARLAAGFDLAEAMLGVNPYPEHLPTPPKLLAHKRSAEAMGYKHTRVPLNLAFKDGHNHAGVRMKACLLCGDCVSGCNHGAKNTVLMNYLPDAKRHGAEIFVEVSVRRVERAPEGGWHVHYELLNAGRASYKAETLFVAADIVVLAAGALGSTEILLRSRDAGKLTVSERLGEGFGGNGDVLGFGYNGTPEVRSVGLGHKVEEGGAALDEAHVIGPTITSIVDMRGGPEWQKDMILAEGAIPAIISAILPGVQRAAAAAGGVNTAPGNAPAQRKREISSAVRGPYHGATAHTQTYLGMCHDDGDGTMKLEDDRLRIDWANVGKKTIITAMNKRIEDATRPLEGVFIANPVWSDVLGKSLITVHPLGGCVMADSAEGGVVDHACRVFSSTTGTAVHEGLYVCDGAVVPTSLGVNPLLTISALAERCCMILAEERGLSIDYTPKGPYRDATEEQKVGLRFTEAMRGFIAPPLANEASAPAAGERRKPDAAFAAAAKRGEAQGASFEFILTISSDDVETMVSDKRHQAMMVGTVTAPSLSAKPLVVTEGVFNLFSEDPAWPGARLMKYAMVLLAEDGKSYAFTGFKVIYDSPVWKLWSDNTTLYITVHEGRDAGGPVVAKGVLRILPDDFIRLLATIDVTNAGTRAERTAATVKFGRFFAGTLYDKYGSIAAPSKLGGLSRAADALSFAEEEVAPRVRRPLRVSAPELVPLQAEDGTELLLSRHKGGAKGPVILSCGIGASSELFSMDTVDTNLLEYLYAEGYDVWLFDDRTSVLMPSARAPHTADDVARKDWPKAVSAVREATGASSVQVVAHGLGAAMFCMAMLNGLSGVRSAVCSQLGTHLVTAKASALRAGLYAPDLPAALGLTSLAAAAGDAEDWVTPLFERAQKADAEGKAAMCENDACARITFMYGAAYEHDRLNEATHDALHEPYGVVSVQLFESIAATLRAGHLVDAAGADAYLPHLDRLAISLLFLHGGANKLFLPESTETSVEALSAKNDAALYTRRVIDGYGHDDCLFGKDAALDVYPHIVEHLDKAR